MSDLAGRAERRIADLGADLRGLFEAKTGTRPITVNRYRQRMSCSDSLRPLGQTQDWTEGMGVSPSGVFRVAENDGRREKILSRKGIRWDVGRGILIAVAAVLVLVLVLEAFGVSARRRMTGKLEVKTQALAAKNEELQQELDWQAGDVSVMTEAVRLNLISGYGARTITLTAPAEANLTLSTAVALEAFSGGRMTSNAGD